MKQIDQRTLSNGFILKVFDLSRHVAADRWLVKIRCEAEIPVLDNFCTSLNVDDQELAAAVHVMIGKFMTYAIERERNFIDEAAKDQVLQELIQQALDVQLNYLESPTFPEKLYKNRYMEFRGKCISDRYYAQQKPQDEDDDGPADFSACFQDK